MNILKERRSMKIYIIDNSMMTWAWILNILSQVKGLQITGFSRKIDEALNAIRRLNPDIIFLNHLMQIRSGVNLIKKIKQINSGTVVAVIGENAPSEFKDKCLKAGADYYFDKIKENRINSTGLLQVVHELKIKRSAMEKPYFKPAALFKETGLFSGARPAGE
jgi:chemotaxis response regulator CheB